MSRSCGTRGRTRTGMTLRSRDFRTTSAFAAVRCRGRSWSGARLHRGSRCRCPPSALYAFPTIMPIDGLGSVSTRSESIRAFADFDGCHLEDFSASAQLFKSLVSTDSTTRANGNARRRYAMLRWRRGSESNRPRRICNPLHNLSATPPRSSRWTTARRATGTNKKGSRWASLETLFKWSGKRGSNSRPQPWQGCALPTELFPL